MYEAHDFMDRTDYVMWGVDIGLDNVNYTRHHAEIDGTDGAEFRIVCCGMSREFAIAGVIIAESDVIDGFTMSDITREVSSMERYANATARIKEKFPDVDPLGFGIKVFSCFS